VILVQNHGLVVLGGSAQRVLDITAMAVKATRILLGTFAAGGPHFMSEKDVARIHTRPDELYRQQQVGLEEKKQEKIMTIQAPYPDLAELLTLIGEAGHRMSEIEASEGAAGNISVYIGWDVDPRRLFPVVETIQLPDALPDMIGRGFLVTGSGRRLREIIQDPAANLGFVRVDEGGKTGSLYTSPRRLFAQLTSEFNSHLAVHRDQVALTGTHFHAVIHAQPPHLVYLSHIPRYRDEAYLNRHLLRWQPEMIVNLPEGIGVVRFALPGSPELMAGTVASLRTHRVVLWCKHGVMARSDQSVKRASDRVEYAETGAHYEYMNLHNNEMAEGLSDAEIRSICSAFNVNQCIF
jgi:rhamnulose-1-phosphate aldolase